MVAVQTKRLIAPCFAGRYAHKSTTLQTLGATSNVYTLFQVG